MSLTTKKILLSIVSFAFALCVAFAVVTFVTNGSNPAYAQGQTKEVVTWAAGTSDSNVASKVAKVTEITDDTITLEKVYDTRGLP